MYKLIVLAAALAVANAGLLAAPAYAPAAYAAPAYAAPAYAAPAYASAAIGSTSQSTLRSLDGNSVVSQYSKAVDTAFSSVRKSDVRVTNDGVALAPAYHAPAVAAYAAPAYAAPAYAAPLAARAYAAPAYATPLAARAYAAPAYGAPLAARAYAAPVAAHAGLLGVAYSAAPVVSHVSYDAPLVHYGW